MPSHRPQTEQEFEGTGIGLATADGSSCGAAVQYELKEKSMKTLPSFYVDMKKRESFF